MSSVVNDTDITEKLMLFGLTRQEANIYMCLFLNEELTGYEAAKKTGISRSNVYHGLSGLTDKGAAYLLEGNSAKYRAVPAEEFCSHKIRTLQREKEYLLNNLPNKQMDQIGYLTVAGYVNIVNKVISMIEQAKQRIYLAAEASFIQKLSREINEQIGSCIKVVLLTDGEIDVLESENTFIYYTGNKKGQIRLIIDSGVVLTGDISGNHEDTCLYCGQPNFVKVFKEAMHNELKLIELEKQQTDKGI